MIYGTIQNYKHIFNIKLLEAPCQFLNQIFDWTHKQHLIIIIFHDLIFWVVVFWPLGAYNFIKVFVNLNNKEKKKNIPVCTSYFCLICLFALLEITSNCLIFFISHSSLVWKYIYFNWRRLASPWLINDFSKSFYHQMEFKLLANFSK